ncbi:unnamed protein product [Clonostachys byssicola]|uniref:Heterokaryon incompatibility domain-containing protein n=1 Tax=Clonostachys byssicola TaxID=160290 RepID=A0A9N9UL80_9HYPO|nr:unnamed protein product [Clonostachys byssicola]
MFAKWELNHLSSIDHDCTVCQRERDLPLNPRLCDSCKGWDDLIHVMDCLEPEYPKINPNCFGLKFGADRDPIFHQSTSIEDYDQDLGSLNYRPLDQHSFSTACMLCCRIDEEIRISISSQSRIEVGVWRPFPVPRKGHQIFRWWEFARVDKLENMDEKSVRLILPVSVKSKATRTPEKLFKTLVIGFELHYAHLGYKLEAITRWNHSLLDPGIVKEFIGNCREHHRSQCNEPRWPAKVPQFFRVIDTKNWCVQLAPEEHFEYLALSYVWGAPTQSQRDINILQLDTTTLPELEQKNSLRKYSIPEVIQDAINLCADLGYQYLWSPLGDARVAGSQGRLLVLEIQKSNSSDGAFQLMEDTRMLYRPQYTMRSLLRSGINEAGPIKRGSCPDDIYL